ncbi:carbohydrate kinase, partial [Actinotalea ferrariae]|uniref:PfkB family carbohydrate kinase n=1 Tax=Actinotalea ferrariae TaxID=1386098 RepID=UPI001C8CB2BA
MERPAGTARHVVACGLATLDVVQTVDRLPAPDEKVVARGLWVAAGGPAANAAVTAAGLGVRATLVSRVGDGTVARVVLDDLHAHDVEVLDLAPEGASPAVSTVLVTASTGERAVVSVNATTPRSLTDVTTSAEAWEDAVASAGAVLVDGHHLDLALGVAAAARSAGVPVLLDGGSWKPGLERLLAVTDVALLSADFRLPGASGTPAALLRAVRGLGPAHVARSQGSGPVQLLVDDDVVEVAVPAVDVVDTLGAGDVLHGALAAWLAVHGPPAVLGDLRAGLTYAAHVASSSCTGQGARGWL